MDEFVAERFGCTRSLRISKSIHYLQLREE